MTYQFNQLSTLQYMGSKSRIISEIGEIILENNDITTVVDLFAGTGSVGFALKPYFNIYSNDLELYAYILNEAILNGCLLTKEKESEIIKQIEYIFQKISLKFNKAIEKETQLILGNEKNYLEYKIFCEDTPSVIRPETSQESLMELLTYVNKIKVGIKKQNIDIPVLFITYYANTYFGIKQCCEIDAIRHTIGQIEEESIRNVMLAILMTAMSMTASTTTHFAQYLKINSMTTCNNIKKKRSLSIREIFLSKLEEFRVNGLLDVPHKTCTCTNLDYLELLNKMPLDETVLVYADPPYFKEHYSRYYHILNTLCLYDYPHISINNQTKDYTIGRYRENRSVSDFGKRKLAMEAFNQLIDICYKNNSKLVISYSDNSIVDIEEILKEMKNKFETKINKIPLKHSKQGRNSTASVEEYIIVGKPIQNIEDNVSLDKVERLISSLKEVAPVSDNPGAFIHNYMARKPFNVVSEIIKQLTPENGIVYDPMFGSGTTLIEASKLGRSGVGTDINELAYRLAKVSLTKWDINRLASTIESFMCSVKSSCENLYVHVYKGENRIIERCHFDRIEDDIIPTMYWYKVETAKGLSTRKKDNTTDAFIKEYNKFGKIEINNVKNHLLIPNSRIAIKEGASVYSYFCYRNLIALDRMMGILQQYSFDYGYEVLEILVSSTINLVRLSDKKASSQIPYWLPKKDLTSRNALFVLQDKMDKMIEGLRYLTQECQCNVVNNYESLINGKGIILKNIPAQQIADSTIPAESIDLILTDPPYTDQVPYLEYSQLGSLIFGWQSHEDDVMKEELVVSNAPSRKKDVADFDKILDNIIEKTAKYLKQGGYFVMFYHSFDLKAWDSIIKKMEKHGFRYRGESPIKAPRKSFKAVLSPQKTLDGNYIIVFDKENTMERVFEGSMEEAKKQAIQCAREVIKRHKKVTSQDLYDLGMLKDSIEKGYLSLLATKYATFIDVIMDEFMYSEGYWEE